MPKLHGEDAIRAAMALRATLGTDGDVEVAALEIARQQQTPDLEIDGDPRFSHADDGVWVSAWVWVSHEDIAQAGY